MVEARSRERESFKFIKKTGLYSLYILSTHTFKNEYKKQLRDFLIFL